MRTSLGMIIRAVSRPTLAPVRAVKPTVVGELLVVPGVNPNKSRKGKSGETPRRAARKAGR